jgi:hypothetical protein
MSQNSKIPFELTFVLYDEGNIIQFFLALLSLCPVFIMAVFTSFSIFEGGRKRIHVCTVIFIIIIESLKTLLTCFGMLFNVAINLILKQFFCYGLKAVNFIFI